MVSMINYSLLTLMFVFLDALLFSQVYVSCHEVSCYCVEPDKSEVNGPNSCQREYSKCQNGSLMYFTHSSPHILKNNSIFYFLSGKHSLYGVFNASANNIENLSLIGCSENSFCGSVTDHKPVAFVQCLPESNNHNGFFFSHIHNLTIIGLGFYNCGFLLSSDTHDSVAGALLLQWVWNLHVSGVDIADSNGWGLSCHEIHGNSLVTNTSISHSQSISNCMSKGGNMKLHYDNMHSHQNTTSFAVKNSNFTNGANCNYTSYGGGIDIDLESTDRIQVLLHYVNIIGNYAYYGGNMALTYKTLNNTWCSSITIDHCQFYNGLAKLGGGLYMSMIADIHHTEGYNSCNDGLVVSVTHSKFFSNSADKVGAGVYIQLHENTLLSMTASISFEHCTFDGNTNLIEEQGRGGSAVNLINFHVPDYKPHQTLQYDISFISCNFTENTVLSSSNNSVGSGALYVEENAFMLIKDCSFLNNNCTGITAVQSNIEFQGNIVLQNNTAYNGGGMVMCANSVMFLNLSKEGNVSIENCHAENFGGGIYAEFECSQAIPPCFFQVSDSTDITEPLIYLTNNTAAKAGTAIYGGAVNYCYAFGPYHKGNKSTVFSHLFHIQPSQQNKFSNISSNPINVCFCDESVPHCSERTRYLGSVYPGGILSVSVVTVGQENGAVPGIVKATPNKLVKSLQTETSQNCTTLHYVVTSLPSERKTIELSVGDSDFKNAAIDTLSPATIKIGVKTCPPGFGINKKQCVCSKWIRTWTDDLTTCNIRTESICRNGNSTWWLGFINSNISSNNSVLVSNKYCPFNYCVKKDVHITVKHQDIQCANSRSGILCGKCRDKLSNVHGSNICKSCRDSSILGAVGLTVLFAVLGIILILFLGILNLTVSEGTLNAIIFYMNVVRVNTTIFFDFPKGNSIITTWLEVFVAWMNLDLGIEMCFYNGMGAVGKTALQFVFPFYMWFLAGLIIYLSKKSSLITKLLGKNAVKILATIIFLLYAKIIQIVITVVRISKIVVDHDNGTRYMYVWTVDGNIPYQEKRHSLLLAFAVIVAAVTLPYTLALLFIQCLRKRSNMRVLFWVNKLKPFFDSYTGPYKDKYHFWTGFLLIVRIFMFIIFAVNVSKGPELNLTLIVATMSLLFLFIQPGIYKKWTLNIIEAFTYTNLMVLVALTAYNMNFHYSSNVPIIICIGSMFLLFCGVVIYHVYKKLSGTQCWGKMKVWLLDKRSSWTRQNPIRSLILNHSGVDDLSSSDSELDPLLGNAPPVVRYDEYREPLIETGEDT